MPVVVELHENVSINIQIAAVNMYLMHFRFYNWQLHNH